MSAPSYPMRRGGPFDPPPQLAAVQSGDRLIRVTLWDGSNPWLITGYDEVRAILSDERVSVDSDLPGYPHMSAGSAARRRRAKMFVNMDKSEHRRVRSLVTPDFLVKRMERLRPQMQRALDGFIDDMLAGPNPADLVEAIALPLPSFAICELLGVPYSERELFHGLSKTIISGRTPPVEAVAALETMLDFMAGLVDAKEKDPGDDMISRLVVQQLRPGTLAREDLVNTAQLMLLGGHETTANMIALGTLALLQHPGVLAEVRASDDPKLIANTVEELLRWLSILHQGRRRIALADIEIGGTVIRAGEGIVVATDIANRDPAAFPEPDTLDIHRKARHQVGFGFGVHQCVGQPLARMELQVVYSTLYRRIPTLALAVGLDDIEFKHDNVVYGVSELPVTW